MESNKLDQLFREKLSRHEMAPSPQAWKAVDAELNQKSTSSVWMGIAATISLVAVASILVLKNSESLPPSSSLTFVPNAPEFPEAISFEIPNIQFIEEPTPAPVEPATPTKVESRIVNEHPAIETPNLIMPGSVAGLTIELVDDYSSESGLGNVTVTEPFDFQLTYIATSTTDEKNGIKKFLERAREITPGEMWASIRETKNDLLSKN